MTRYRTFPAFLVALSLAAAAATPKAGPIDPKDPPDGRFMDDWAEVYMAGGKIGYTQSTMTREGDLIHTSTVTKMRVGRIDVPVEIETVQTTTETLDGAPVKFSFDMDASVMKTSMRGTVANGRVTIVSAQYGIEQTQVFAFPASAVMIWGMFRESLLRGFAPGSQYTLKAYVPELRLDGPVSAITNIGEWEDFEHRGRKLRGRKVTVTLESPIGSMEIISWVDKDGRLLRAEVPVAGLGNIVMITTDQATALADFVPPEVFMKTVIKAKRKIDPKAAHRITYRIHTTTPDVGLGELPTTGMQRVINQTDGSVELVVSRQSHKRPEPRAASPLTKGGLRGVDPRADTQRHPTLQPDELAEYLKSNLMMNTADPKLMELAKRASGGETDPYVLGDKLRRFVTDYVETKSLNIGFATASEVCRNKEGDCSEHGVLLAALGRLNGLPSRVAVGIAYVPSLGGQNGIFGYHMWTQFYIDGRWVDFDAAMNESVCSPTRIAFATSSLKNTGLADLSLPLLSKIGAIDIDILEVEEMPRTADR